MRKSSVVPFLFVIFGAVLGASSAGSNVEDFMRREREYGAKMSDSAIPVFGRSKSSVDFAFGDNPETVGQGNSNVKTSRRREPSIQAYGLPKRTIADNGFIERVNFDRTSGLDGKVEKVNSHGKIPGIQAFGLSKRIAEDNGFIERVGADNHDEKAPASASEKFSSVRRTRSIDKSAKNDLADLDEAEAKVFRPLFVYRQQVADRYRVNPRKNPIYGAYQYGTNGKKNYVQRSRKYY